MFFSGDIFRYENVFWLSKAVHLKVVYIYIYCILYIAINKQIICIGKCNLPEANMDICTDSPFPEVKIWISIKSPQGFRTHIQYGLDLPSPNISGT